MYSPQPPTDGGWWEARLVLADGGGTVDVLHGLRDGRYGWEPSPAAAVPAEGAPDGAAAAEAAAAEAAPAVPSQLYRSWRWERFLYNLGKTAGRREWLRQRESAAPRSLDGGGGAGGLRGKAGCAAGSAAEATERLEWLAGFLCAKWAAANRSVPTAPPADAAAILELDWLYVARLPEPGGVAVAPRRTRELTYACPIRPTLESAYWGP